MTVMLGAALLFAGLVAAGVAIGAVCLVGDLWSEATSGRTWQGRGVATLLLTGAGLAGLFLIGSLVP